MLPPSYDAGRHFHDEQQELYFVHSGRVAIEFGDGSSHELGPGGVARVDAATVRGLRNLSDSEDAVYLAVGGKDGYVGRDGRLPEGEPDPRGGAETKRWRRENESVDAASGDASALNRA